ncbi:MAG: hypothetical protein IPN34_22335 [Planctomycetes bacterium]|nr:hypothetical protein [Planctomycetota bacterium]
MNLKQLRARIGCAALVLSLAPALLAQNDDLAALVARLRGADVAARDAAAAAASALGSTAIAPIGGLLALEDLDVVDAARRALIGIASRATAPGTAEGERAATARALLDLLRLEMPLPPLRRAFVLRQLAIVVRGTSETLEIARHLDDPALSEAALFALERITSPIADALLLERLARADLAQPPRAALIASLGARRSRAAVPQLVELAAQEGNPLAASAREALARIGDPAAATVLRAAVLRGEAGAADAYLRLLEQRLQHATNSLREGGDSLPLLLSAPQAGTRLAAIDQLQAYGFDAPLGTWIGLLGDPAESVRSRVRALLVASSAPELDATLSEAATQGTPAIRSGALRALFERDPAKARPLIVGAATEGDASVRSAAITLLAEAGDPSDEALILAALEQPELLASAADALLERGSARATAGEGDAARALLRPLLAKPLDLERLGRALLALAPLADESDLARLEPLLANDALREELAAVRLGVAERLPAEASEKAQALLWQIVDATKDREKLRAIATALKARGAAVDGIAAKKGFVTRWKLMGSFARSDGKPFAWWPFAESGPTLNETITIDDVNYAWRDIVTEDFEGHFDLLFLEPKLNCYAFAAVDIDWPKDETVELKLGSDDGVVVWVNGKLVHQNDTSRGLRTDEDRCTAEMKQGSNRIVVKIVQGGGGFGFCLRLPAR